MDEDTSHKDTRGKMLSTDSGTSERLESSLAAETQQNRRLRSPRRALIIKAKASKSHRSGTASKDSNDK